ncbi:hypothetical protein [Streptomyces sp. NPDC047841]|uniref:hypothetical protein n=1 Tax=Streptomyces sp. NPDC047841 TaxID=3154708 RepID=UPI003452C61D
MSTARFSILSVGPSGNLMLMDATITNGDAPDFGGGIANRGQLTVTNSAIRNNHGNFSGGIGAGFGTTTHIVGTSIMGNSANVNGGGVANDGNMTISNSRVIDNTAGASGGGVLNAGGSVVLTSSRVRGNQPTNCAGSDIPIPNCAG